MAVRAEPEVIASLGKASMRSLLTKVSVAAAAGAAVVLAAGCGNSSSPGHHSSAAALSPLQVITLAADQSKQVTSFSSTLNMQMAGLSWDTITGTMEEQSQPSLLVNVNMSTLNIGGQNLPGGLQEIVTGQAVYMKMAALSQQLGKPWIVIPFSELKNGIGAEFSSLAQQAETSDPLVQTQMFTSAKDVRAVGTQVVGGVETTHYTGTYSASAGITKLPASLRALATTQLQTAGITQVHFDVWIDAQHQVRQITVTEQGKTEHTAITMQVTGTGQQVKVAIPPASQTATLPASALKNL
jgi:hypothetical protein